MKAKEQSWQFIEFANQLSEVKINHNNQLLALSTLLELLVEKGLLTSEEIQIKATAMENEVNRQILLG